MAGLLLLSLLGVTSTITPATAATDEVEWSRVNIPTEGRTGNWMLADNSDVQQLSMAIDSSLYCYADVGGEDVLFRSEDDGRSWTETDYDGGAIADIVCSNTDAGTIYITDGSHVYKTEDAADTFQTIADATLPALDANESITCLDAGSVDGDRYLFIGTADSDGGDFGGVYYIAETSFGAHWADLALGNYDTYSIACPPEPSDDFQVIALVTDEARSWVINNYGTVGNWSGAVELTDAGGNGFDIVAAADIRFPADYDDEFFVGVAGDAVSGGVYRVHPDAAFRLDGVDADITSLDLTGSTGNIQLMAGAQDDNGVYYSSDDGDSWQMSDKAPSGDGPTCVVMADDFAARGGAYAVVSGTESAFSNTTDGAATWNQVSLIDTSIQAILNLVPSPNYHQDNTLFMLTWGGEHSLWRSRDNATTWERVFSSNPADVDSLSMVALSPRYGNANGVVFLAGASNGNPVTWQSTDSGRSFSRRRIAPLTIDIWAIVDDTTLFIGGFDGVNGLVYSTDDSGQSYSTGTEVGNQALSSIALSPDYDEDETLLIGNTDGWVYWSDDNGTSFEPLPYDAAASPLTDSITVAFDTDFSSNSTVYAASDTADGGIHRFIIDSSTEWSSIDSTLPAGGMLKHPLLSADGTLYAVNFEGDGGMERCLNPTYSLGPTFETVTRGLDDGATLTNLWLQGDILGAIDSTNLRVMTFADSLAAAVVLESPADEAPGTGTVIDDTVKDIRLDWAALSGATEYQWQLDDDTNFSEVSFEDETEASSARLPDLEPATTYYWRVRATEPVLSPWSEKWSFTTSIGGEAIVPQLISPAAGASAVSLKPIFQWSAIASAESYELIVSTDAALSNPTVLKTGDYTLPNTAWQCNINLNYATAYYWKVRAISSDSCSDWSAVGAFTTAPPPEEVSAPPPAPVQAPAPAPPDPSPATTTESATPDWVKYLIGALSLTIILLLITMITLVIVTRRS